MCQGLPYQSLSFLGDRGAVLYALQVARGPVMIWNGRADSIVAKAKDPFFAELRTRARQLAGRPDAVFEIGFTDGTGHRPYFLTRPVVSWLAAELGFPNWTPATVTCAARGPHRRLGAHARHRDRRVAGVGRARGRHARPSATTCPAFSARI